MSVERIGFVGLPNSGKSSLFNALTGGSAPVASHPFSTTETSVGVAQVPDHRLDALAEMSSSKKVVHAGVELVDIAGLVAGSCGLSMTRTCPVAPTRSKTWRCSSSSSC